MTRQQQIEALLVELRSRRHGLMNQSVCIGFDGYIDRIVHAVKQRSTPENYTRFHTIAEYANHLQACAGRSGDIEIVPVTEEVGGNAPIMAQAMARLGVPSTCVGTLGEYEIHPVFSNLSHFFNPQSIGKPASTLAIEFSDGKIMLGEIEPLHQVTWEHIKHQLGIQKIAEFFQSSRCFGIVNWSSIYAMDGILRGIIEEVFPLLGDELAEKFVFVDIADPSARSRHDILNLAAILKELNTKAKVVLGLNRKEAGIVYESLGYVDQDQPQEVWAQAIVQDIELHGVVIHSSNRVTGILAGVLGETDVFHLENPARTTGVGDHFNAGFCTGLLLNLSLLQCLHLGNLTASSFLTTGQSPSFDDLLALGECGNPNNEKEVLANESV
ncbi:hypothetical protein [Paenibacillus roseipurpureus]|uniref:Carbohydrate kinase PfkB domain-containing protein n=1 Tax=Paenibacillus roseopurpureus TaxID=2918901 RepID=A0AA96RM20_9BACL|nr:hypothetical protein [Paenibacillus sp. MBLB1832]WNR46009.1 hypothetical protein MJB10_07915 [Paenibacillus sp. MBLB1832]